MKQAHDKAGAEGSLGEEQTRFKVQEMHFLNELYNQFQNITYKSDLGAGETWFEFSKAIKNNILVELNISALGEVYDLDSAIFKDVIGSLNWKKFSERIRTQLKENPTLTLAQRNSMTLNAIISLIKSNAFDEAKQMLDKAKKQSSFSSVADQSNLRTLEVYFFTKDKKYEEGLKILQNQEATAETVFLRAHLLLALKKQKESILELVNLSLRDSRLPLTQLILRLANNYKLLDLPEVKSFVKATVQNQMVVVQKTG